MTNVYDTDVTTSDGRRQSRLATADPAQEAAEGAFFSARSVKAQRQRTGLEGEAADDPKADLHSLNVYLTLLAQSPSE